MLFKLALTGMKSRMRDYFVLFFGLLVASSVFYMFESLALNKEFLLSNPTIGSVIVVFRIGTVLLSLITVVYIFYANTFLMNMRQKSYALLMMLGAKVSKIATMIFIETLTIGFFSTLVGGIFGIGLTSIVQQLLMKRLNIQVSNFSSWNTHAFMVTILFFIFLFFIVAIMNALSLIHQPILQLLKQEETPVRVKNNPFLFILEAITGFILLLISGYLFLNIAKHQIFGLTVSVFTVTLGTYFLFHSTVIAVLRLLKRLSNYSSKGLNNFTLGQLNFRIRDYTKILAMVTIIFALALGAITVGVSFKQAVTTMTKETASYDLVLNHSEKINEAKIQALEPVSEGTYHFKEDSQKIYYNASEWNEMPLKVLEKTGINTTAIKVQYTGDDFLSTPELIWQIKRFELTSQNAKESLMLSANEFAALDLSEGQLSLIEVNDFEQNIPLIQALVEENQANNPEIKGLEDINAFSQKYYVYELFNSLFSGFEFMGFFLGISFLTMLASCLMFKILSSAAGDQKRYEMLAKIGAPQTLLKRAIHKEIAILFLLPGIVGMLHVLFGLQMFTEFMRNPYSGVPLAFGIFLTLYFIYYLLTVHLYSRIVFQKN